MQAGAGSGKTTSLIKALDYVVKTYGGEFRRRRQQVACITYTEMAVGEIWSDVGNNPLCHVSTIHSFLWALAKPFQKDIAEWVKGNIERKLSDLQEKQAAFGNRTRQTTRVATARDIEILKKDLAQSGNVHRFTYESARNYPEGVLGHDDILKMVPQLIKENSLLSTIIANKYPYFFVDESQDTFPEVVEALRCVAVLNSGKMCLGFFGDPMQQIYATGIGPIALESGWERFDKPENFRCPPQVLSVINNIRSRGDHLVQTLGDREAANEKEQPIGGIAKLFVLPADERKVENLARVREWLAKNRKDPHWNSDSRQADVRILVIVHRMAAIRLGFADLYAAFNDDAPDSFAAGFREADVWPLRPFLDILLPLAAAVSERRDFEVISLLRAHSPRLEPSSVKDTPDPARLLASLENDTNELTALMSISRNASVRQVLQFVQRTRLLKLDERLLHYIEPPEVKNPDNTEGAPLREPEEDGDETDKLVSAMNAYLACPVQQLWGYRRYISDESPYSTQHGIKGAEFERVLVVIDEEEGRFFQFSYEKLLGLKELSDTDIKNQAEGKETVMDRTRRLFYVGCSRATRDLAVVIYIPDVATAESRLRAAGIFQPEDIHTLADIEADNTQQTTA